MNRMRKGMAALLCSLLFVGLLPAAASAADIQEGTPAFTINSTVVAFAGREWYVIGNGTSGVSPKSGHLTLLAKDSFGNSAFRAGNVTQDDPHWAQYPADHWYYEGSFTQPNDYNDSTLMRAMNALVNALPHEEAAVITPCDLDDTGGTAVTNQKIWPLSKNEFDSMGLMPSDDYSDFFWLRSAIYHSFGFVGVPGGGGTYIFDVTDSSAVVRPSLHLNLASVLFTSDAGGVSSKASATVGSGLISASAPTQNLKFTMRNSAQTLVVIATPEQSTQSATSLSFSYQSATTGSDQYLSCVLLDALGTVKYYASWPTAAPTAEH